MKVFPDGVFLPIDGSFTVRSQTSGGQVVLSWKKGASTAEVFYRVLRAPAFTPNPVTAASPPIVRGVSCQHKTGSHADDCSLFGTSVIATTAGRTLTDRPPPGRWTYYVALASNWLDDPQFGDILLLSRPVTVKVGQ